MTNTSFFELEEAFSKARIDCGSKMTPDNYATL